MKNLFNTIQSNKDQDERLSLGLRLYREISNFIPGYLHHLKNEEENMMPKVWEHFTDEELMKMNGEAMSAIKPEDVMRFLPLVFPSINIDERTGLFMGMKQIAPPQAVEAAAKIIQGVLSEEEWSALAGRVGL